MAGGVSKVKFRNKLEDEAFAGGATEGMGKAGKIHIEEATPKNTKIRSTISIGNKPVIIESWWIIDKNGMPYCSTIILIEVK